MGSDGMWTDPPYLYLNESQARDRLQVPDGEALPDEADLREYHHIVITRPIPPGTSLIPLGIPDEWKMPPPVLADGPPPAAPARDPLATVIQANLSSHRSPSPAAHADALAKIVRAQLAAELVPLLVEHSCCHDSTGYAVMCDCDDGPYNRDADGNRLKDEEPITLYAEHIASLIRR